jgi:hypothetical protein
MSDLEGVLKAHTQVPNAFLEMLYSPKGPKLSRYDRAVLDVLIRYSFGFKGDQSKSVFDAKVTQTFIANGTGIARTNVNRSMKKLVQLGLVKKIRQGLYRMLVIESIYKDTF